MDHQSLTNVLGILRVVKANPNKVGADVIRVWVGLGEKESAILKVASFIIEQVQTAQTVINNSHLNPEAKEGVLDTLGKMAAAFSLKGLASHTAATIGNVPGAISNFAILLSAMGIEMEPSVPDEATELAKEVETLMAQFDDGDLDPIVREMAKRHLATLATLLRHIPIFGLEAAMTTYFEMIMRLRRADANTSDKSQEKMTPLFQHLENWWGRLQALDKIWNVGARWVGHADKAMHLLNYSPHS